MEHGETAYRGRNFKPQHLSPDQIQKARPCSHTPQTRPSHHQTCREAALHRTPWNCGGLAYQDFLYWLTLQTVPPQIVILVETRLAHHMEHATDQYFIVHSAKPHAGVLIMVHKSVAPLHRVTWRIIEPGRILHGRVYGNCGHLHIIGYYQQAWQPQSPGTCWKERSRIQAKLEQVRQSAQPIK